MTTSYSVRFFFFALRHVDLGEVVVEGGELILDQRVDARALLEVVGGREEEALQARVRRSAGLGDVEALRRLRRRLLVVALRARPAWPRLAICERV